MCKAGFNAARGFVGGAAPSISIFRLQRSSFNAARGFVGGAATKVIVVKILGVKVSMPHAALWVVQLTLNDQTVNFYAVSMPHAALWVVQRRRER